MEPLDDEIRGLTASIKKLEGVRERFLEDPKSYVKLTEEITEKQKTLNIYLESQKGKFA